MLSVRHGSPLLLEICFVVNFDSKPTVFPRSVGSRYNSRPICDPNSGYVVLHEGYVVTQTYDINMFIYFFR